MMYFRQHFEVKILLKPSSFFVQALGLVLKIPMSDVICLLLAPLQNTSYSLLQMEAGEYNAQLLAVWISLAAAALLVLLIMALYFFVFNRPVSEEERQLREGIAALRIKLGITWNEGFSLSSEHSLTLNWVWRRQEQYTIVQHSYIEAAARLLLFLDFDVHKFDAFCLCLQCSGANNFSMGGDIDDCPTPYRALCSWMLDVTQQLIRPSLPNLHPRPELQPELIMCCALPDELRFPYFLRLVSKCRIWTESGGALFKELKLLAQVHDFPM
jgi:hypothetical protein